MTNQGLCGALKQYWTIEEKPRLTRRNTYFEDKRLSNYDALKFGVAVSTIVTAIVLVWSLMGMML